MLGGRKAGRKGDRKGGDWPEESVSKEAECGSVVGKAEKKGAVRAISGVDMGQTYQCKRTLERWRGCHWATGAITLKGDNYANRNENSFGKAYQKHINCSKLLPIVILS
jgi:hypothetical protein